jgi:hypothetical protein
MKTLNYLKARLAVLEMEENPSIPTLKLIVHYRLRIEAWTKFYNRRKERRT